MLPLDQAHARHHAYTLFGRLLLQPLTADLLPYLQSIPDLAAALPDPFDPDQTAAAHHTLFAFNLFPYASIFLAPSRLLGGPITNEHESLYRQSSFVPDPAVEPDHLGQAFTFLAHLSQLEAHNLESGQSAAAPQTTQLNFLQNHLLPWLPPCTIAIQQQNNPFYGRLAQLSLALVADHYATLKSTQSTQSTQLPINQSTNQPIHNSQFTSPLRAIHNSLFPPQSTNQPNTLRDLSHHLTTPILSGLHLGRTDITHLARRLNLPHGFGRRDQMLHTLLQSAAQYDTAPQLIAALQELVTHWQQAYQQLALDYPETADFLPPWQTRTTQTQQLLTQMA